MGKAAKSIQFNYYHNREDLHKIIKHSSEIILKDNRFKLSSSQYLDHTANFAVDSTFLRGCVSISHSKRIQLETTTHN